MTRQHVVVVLAGGEGRRIGGAKPLRLLAGQSLIARSIERARLWSDRVAVSVRHAGNLRLPDVDVITDEIGEGPIAGLESAMRYGRAAGARAVLTIPCDIPLAPSDLMERLSVALECGAAAAVAESGQQLHWSAALWSTDVRGVLRTYISSGRRSLAGFAAQVGFAAVHWPTEPYDPFLNINTTAEVAAAERHLRGR